MMKELIKPKKVNDNFHSTFFYAECSGSGSVCLKHNGGEACCSGGVANKGCSGGAANNSFEDDIDILF